VANGAIHTIEDAERCLAETGAVAVMGATGLLRDPRMFTHGRSGSSADERDPFALAREYLRFVADYPIMDPYGMRNIRDHMRQLLRDEMKRGGVRLESMFRGVAIKRSGQYCALVSALAAELGLEPPLMGGLTMKQIKVWSDDTAASFECRCGGCR
jgi:tRNA-dihydrouridine synthase